MVTRRSEAAFANVLQALRTSDKSVTDPSVRFFAEGDFESDDDDENDGDGETTVGKFTMKDEFHRGVATEAGVSGDSDDDENADSSSKTKKQKSSKKLTREDKASRAAFLDMVNAGAEETGEFSVRKNEVATGADVTADVVATAARKKKTKSKKDSPAFATKEDDNEDEKFLLSFFRDEGWRSDPAAAANKYSWEDEAADEQDEQFFDEAEEWEREYQARQFRHEEGANATEVQSFPRQQEGLLRAKDNTRKAERERRQERKQEEELRATEELKRLKALKRQEIDDQRVKIAKVAGLDEDKLPGGWTKEALEKDFDPEEFDKQMAAMFDDEYYDDIDDDEVAAMDEELDEEEVAGLLAATAGDGDEEQEEESEEDDEDDEDDDDVLAAEPKKKTTKKTKKKATKKQTDAGADDDFLYPTKALTKALTSNTAPAKEKKANRKAAAEAAIAVAAGAADPKALKEELQQKVDEYWRLHYNDMAGGVRTRFRYRNVPSENFGFTDEDILTYDDRTLNMLSPMNNYSAYLTEQQNKADRFKVMHRKNNLRTLPSDVVSRRYKANTVVFDPDAINEEEGTAIAEKVKRQAKRLEAALAPDTEEETKQDEEEDADNNKNSNKKNKKKGAYQDRRRQEDEAGEAVAKSSAEPEKKKARKEKKNKA